MTDGIGARPGVATAWSHVEGHETALLERCRQGEEAAFAELVEAHQRMVYQLALHLLGDPQEALDLCQDVFLRVFRSLPSFRGQSALRTWIYRIAVTQVRNRQRWWRRRWRHAQVSLDQHVEAYGELPTTMLSAAPDRVLSQKELARRLWSAVDALPFEQRTVIVLREVDGLSYEEIAFSLGVAVSTVRSRLGRARDALRASLRGA